MFAVTIGGASTKFRGCCLRLPDDVNVDERKVKVGD